MGKLPRLAECLRPLISVLDDVHHITNVDDIRFLPFSLGTIYGVPPLALNAPSSQRAHVISAPTAVVEYGAVFVNQPRLGREAQRMALFIFDIDHFKNYNDTNGHPAGDELLRRLSKLLKETLRPGDWCCRYGGEEFLVAILNVEGAEGLRVAESIRAAIEAQPFEHQEKQPGGNVTISGGVAVYPTDGSSLEELTLHADEALYNAKRDGRNKVMRYAGVGIGDFHQEEAVGAEPFPVS